MTEADYAQKVLIYLNDRLWDCYPEVKYRGSRADIVAVRNGLVWIIEVKLSLSLSVLNQAYHWLGKGNWVSIATPMSSRGSIVSKILKVYGIGHLWGNQKISEDPVPHLWRKSEKDRVLKILCEEQKAYAAGNSNNEFYSPFKKTCDEIRKEVRKNPGMTLRELIKEINHHYYSDLAAKSSLYGWIRAGTIKGVKFEKINNKLRVFEEKTRETK